MKTFLRSLLLIALVTVGFGLKAQQYSGSQRAAIFLAEYAQNERLVHPVQPGPITPAVVAELQKVPVVFDKAKALTEAGWQFKFADSTSTDSISKVFFIDKKLEQSAIAPTITYLLGTVPTPVAAPAKTEAPAK